MSRRGATVCHRGSEMQILEPSPAALLSIRLDSYCYFCTELQREAAGTILGPKRCSNVTHSDVSCFSQLLLYVPSENTFGDILKL